MGRYRGLAGKCMDVAGANTVDGTPVTLYTCHNGDNQKWTYTPDGLIFGLGGKCLQRRSDNYVVLSTCTGSANQKWSGYDGAIWNFAGSGVLDVAGGSSADGTPLAVYPYHGGPNQQWGYELPSPVSLYPQETAMWCWAASGQMIMSYLGNGVRQCDQANARFSRTDCCNTPTPSACIQGGWPEFEKFGFRYQTSGALSWSDLSLQMQIRRPVAFSWGWTGGGGHMMVAIGTKTVAGQNYVTINNPWAPNVGDQYDITYSEYVSGADHVHWTDYYSIYPR